jgi:archaeosine-15-forming tRNA-guanine transglycosylase
MGWLDSVGIGNGMALARFRGGDWIGVLDMADGVLRVQAGDSLLTLGAKGAGPGELRRPVAVSVRGDEVAILDLAGRVLVWDLATASEPAQISFGVSNLYPSLALLRDGSVVIPSNQHPEFIGERIDTSGHSVPWGSAPGFRHEEGFTLNLVQLVDDRVAVLDNVNGSLLIYSEAGEQLESMPLPSTVRALINDGLAGMRAEGRDVVGNPYVIGMHEMDDGSVFLRLAPIPESPVAIIMKPGVGLMSVIHTDGLRADDQSIIRGARSLLFVPPFLFALAPKEVYEYRTSLE